MLLVSVLYLRSASPLWLPRLMCVCVMHGVRMSSAAAANSVATATAPGASRGDPRLSSPVKWLTSCWKTCGLFVYYSAFARGCPSRFSGGLSHGLWYSDHRSLAPRAAAPRSTASCTRVSRSQSCPPLTILADLHLTPVSRGRDHSALLRW